MRGSSTCGWPRNSRSKRRWYWDSRSVELLGDPLAHLVQHRTSVESRRGSLDERAGEPVRTSASATPGRCTLTATSSPSLVRARWDLAERGDGELVDMANSSRTRASRSC
jgi:hypothetical protein